MEPYQVLLAIDDADTATTFADIGRESGEFVVARTAVSSSEVLSSLDDDVDVVVLHESLGPLPVLDLARDLSTRRPDTGMVLLARQPTQDLLDHALRSGFRGIAHLPLELEELQATTAAAGEWTRAVRQRLRGGEDDDQPRRRGYLLALAGGKGGVGTTTLAVQLAVAAQGGGNGQRVCLVDFDLQAGDARSLLDLTHRRSVADLVDVATDLSGRHVDDALSTHESGLRVLLPPAHGEVGEDVDAVVARHVLGGIRSRFDVVVVDAGAVMSEASIVAVELADQVLVVTTPDVPAMRAANRLLELWDRLQARNDHVKAVINRASRDSEIQADMVRRVLDVDTLDSTVPAGFWSLETAVNTGAVHRLDSGPVRDGIDQLAEELDVVPARRRGRSLTRRQRGSVTVEFLGVLPLILIVALAVWQASLAGFTYVLSTAAAREAATALAVTERSDSELQPYLEQVAADRLPEGWRSSMALERMVDDATGTEHVTVRLDVPILIPGQRSPWSMSSQAGTVRETSHVTEAVVGLPEVGP